MLIMKKIMIYFLATALVCGLVVSLGHAQAPRALENAPPFVQPLPPSIPDLRGCWRMVAIINLGTSNVASKLDIKPIYLEVTTQDGTRCSGTLYIPTSVTFPSYIEYPIWGFINGTNVSAFSNTSTPETHRYITATLTEEAGELVMYGISVLSGPYMAGFLNQIATFMGTRPGVSCP
jgi:hypothetical protein